MNALPQGEWINALAFERLKENVCPNICRWLQQAYHLTQTIKQTGGQFSLSCLTQGLGQPYEEEYETSLINKTIHQKHFIREVFLKRDNAPIIFARVIISPETYLKYKILLDNLGNAPIGERLLYADKSLHRSQFEYMLASPTGPYAARLANLANDFTYPIWARRSSFQSKEGIIRIAEFFSPTLPLFPQ